MVAFGADDAPRGGVELLRTGSEPEADDQVAAGPDPTLVRCLCTLAGAAGVASLLIALVGSNPPWEHPLASALFGLGIASLQIVPLRLSHEGQGENLHIEEAFLVPMALYLTPAESLTVLGCAGLLGQVWHRRGWFKSVFNTGEMVTAAAAGLAVSRLLGARVGDLGDGALLAAAAGGVVYAAVSMLLVTGVIAAVQRTRYMELLRGGLEVRVTTWIVSIAVGVMMSAALDGRLWLLLVMALPVAMFQIACIRAFSQFTERRKIEGLYEAAGSIRSSMDSRRVVEQVLASSQRLLDATEARLVPTGMASAPGALRADIDGIVAVEVTARIAGGAWADNDQGLLRALASVASSALTNATLFERLRAVTSSLAEGVVSLDREGLVTFANPAAERMLGVGSGALDGRSLHDVVHARPGPDAPPPHDCRLEAVLGSDITARDDDELFMRADGTQLPVAVTTSPVLLDERVLGTVMAFRDMTERKAFEEELAHQVFHDALTGLSNRGRFADRLEQAHARATRSRARYAVLFIDLDRFKVVNDSLGHHAGDELLIGVAGRLKAKVRPGDTFARFGGDEFVMLLEDLTNDDDAEVVAQRVLQDLEASFRVQGRDVPVSASIGVVVGHPNHTTPEHCLRDADVAMYRAKAKGKARYEIFRPGSESGELERLDREIALRRALDEGELEVHYQPVVALATLSIVGLEALVRWRHPTDGLVPPGDFIPLAEETGLILPLGRWVLEEACRQLRAWTGANPGLESLVMSVNLSSHQFRQPDLCSQVTEVLALTGLPPGQLCLEVTESAMMADATATTLALSGLKQLGTSVSIDDFGTGYSSLSYLKRFPVDFVKIDRSFISDLAEGEVDTEIVRAVIRLSAAIGMRAVAEGVENETQLQLLRELGCPLVQGYHLARPQPAGDIEVLLLKEALGAGPRPAVL